MSQAPTLHVIAGPNGAGKSTLYQTRLKDRYPDVEFVNPDHIAEKMFGRHPASDLEAKQAAQAAEQRRIELIAGKQDLIVESTFSHESKLDLIRDAKANGYAVRVHHVNVRSANVSVARVANRAQEGGHTLSEEKIRARYERSKDLIKAAVKLADKAVVWDNSEMGVPPKIAIQFSNGVAVKASDKVPAWAQALYEPELAHFSKTRLNAAAASFAEAREIVGKQDPGAPVYIARPGRYKGSVVAETSMHLVQQLSAPQGATKELGSYVAHFKKSLDKVPEIGRAVEIVHAVGKVSTVTDLALLT